jgi:hypothetical protein
MRPIFFTFLIFAGTAFGQSTNFIASPFNSQNTYVQNNPFLTFNTQAASERYQQVYASSDFSRAPGPNLITEISFSTGAAFLDVTLQNVEITFSTTQKQPDGLSSTFAQNVGSDATSVFSGPLHLFSRGLDTYGLRIPLQQPFLYDSALGNLLLDVKNFQTIPPSALVPGMVAAGDPGDTSSLAVALDVNSATALLGSGALLTEFTMKEVPEPRPLSLLLLAVPVIAWRHRSSIGPGGSR